MFITCSDRGRHYIIIQVSPSKRLLYVCRHTHTQSQLYDNLCAVLLLNDDDCDGRIAAATSDPTHISYFRRTPYRTIDRYHYIIRVCERTAAASSLIIVNFSCPRQVLKSGRSARLQKKKKK